MDLIAGLPHQTRESWEEFAERAVRPAPGARFDLHAGNRRGQPAGQGIAGGRKPLQRRRDSRATTRWRNSTSRLARGSPPQGYEHYEISNWALPGCRSRHNLKYWRREPYIGFGAGAHSFDGRTRWANVHDSARYVACIEQGISPREQIEAVTPEQALEEEFFLGLAATRGHRSGADRARLQQRTARTQCRRFAGADRRICESQGLVELSGTFCGFARDALPFPTKCSWNCSG